MSHSGATLGSYLEDTTIQTKPFKPFLFRLVDDWPVDLWAAGVLIGGLLVMCSGG